MIKYLFYYFIFLFIPIMLEAQDCTEASLRNKPGTWKPGIEGSVQNVTPPDLAKERNILAEIKKMIAENYSPAGCQITYSNAFGKNLSAGENWIADPYDFRMYILRYICDKKSPDKSKYIAEVATPTTVEISINTIHWANTLYAADFASDETRGYLRLKVKPVKKGNAYFMGEEITGDYGMPSVIVEYRWLIVMDNKLPFSYMDRKEYLLIQKKRLEKTMRDEGNSAFYTQFMQRIDEALKYTDADLEKPAICKWNDEERFTGFVEEGSPGSFFAIKPNRDYYNKNLSKSTPQFFTVVYTLAHGNAVFEENMDAIEKAVDFEKLKMMLGK